MKKLRGIYLVDWTAIPTGTKFKAINHDEDNGIMEGRIFTEGPRTIYLCQNQHDGSPSPDKLGYRYSWRVNEHCKHQVTILSIEIDPTYELEKQIRIGDHIVDFNSTAGCINVGCQMVPFETIKKIIDRNEFKSWLANQWAIASTI